MPFDPGLVEHVAKAPAGEAAAGEGRAGPRVEPAPRHERASPSVGPDLDPQRAPAARAAGVEAVGVGDDQRVRRNRKDARRRRHEREAHAESLRAASKNCALEQILSEERRARVQGVLGEMKPRDAQLLLLRADGLAYRELAESLGVQTSSVGTLLARAEAEFERKFRARHPEG